MLKVSSRWGTTLISIAFIALGILIFAVATKFPLAQGTTLGPGYLPSILAIGLIISAFVNLISAWAQKDIMLDILEPKFFLLFVILSFAHIPLADNINYYFGTFIFLFASFSLLNKAKRTIKTFIQNLLASIATTGTIYFIFGFCLDLF